MVKLLDGGAYLVNGNEVIPETSDVAAILKSKLGDNVPTKEEAKKFQKEHGGMLTYARTESGRKSSTWNVQLP